MKVCEEVSWRLIREGRVGRKRVGRSGLTEESDVRSEEYGGPLRRVGVKERGVFSVEIWGWHVFEGSGPRPGP